MIEDLVSASAAKSGLSIEQARLALSAAMALIQKHGDPAKVSELLQAIPGADRLAAEGASLADGKAGLMTGLLKIGGGAGGAAMTDAMAMGPRLAREGVTTSDMQAILPVAMAFVHEQSGRDLLRDVLASIPALGKLLIAQS
ncbi:MAG: hypothetical protein ABIO39_09025 [Caulobacteraceae bacterium]